MADISFFHIGSTKRTATEKTVENIRTHHPNAYYFLGSDSAENFSELAIKHKCDYFHFNNKQGGPTQPYGWDVPNMIEFLNRFRIACLRCNTTHMMMAEDDVYLTKPVTVEPHWEMACHDVKIGNIIPESVHDMIERFAGKRPTFKQYAGGGGSIYKVDTFIQNYDRVTTFFLEQGEYIMKNLYPTIGWLDCYMVVYYYLCGKDYTANPYMTDTHHHVPDFDYDKFISEVPEHIQIINNYKKYYWS